MYHIITHINSNHRKYYNEHSSKYVLVFYFLFYLTHTNFHIVDYLSQQLSAASGKRPTPEGETTGDEEDDDYFEDDTSDNIYNELHTIIHPTSETVDRAATPFGLFEWYMTKNQVFWCMPNMFGLANLRCDISEDRLSAQIQFEVATHSDWYDQLSTLANIPVANLQHKFPQRHVSVTIHCPRPIVKPDQVDVPQADGDKTRPSRVIIYCLTLTEEANDNTSVVAKFAKLE